MLTIRKKKKKKKTETPGRRKKKSGSARKNSGSLPYQKLVLPTRFGGLNAFAITVGPGSKEGRPMMGERERVREE